MTVSGVYVQFISVGADICVKHQSWPALSHNISAPLCIHVGTTGYKTFRDSCWLWPSWRLTVDYYCLLWWLVGRTHRSNQVSAPEYIFLISQLAGEQRFASTVAKRLECLVRILADVSLCDMPVSVLCGLCSLVSFLNFNFHSTVLNSNELHILFDIVILWMKIIFVKIYSSIHCCVQ